MSEKGKKKSTSGKEDKKSEKKSDKGTPKKKDSKSKLKSVTSDTKLKELPNPQPNASDMKTPGGPGAQLGGGLQQLPNQDPLMNQQNYGLGGPIHMGGPQGQNLVGSMGQQTQQDAKNLCFLHQKELRYYCDSCEELICYDCTVMGPHNTQLHRISSIDEAFRYRFSSVNMVIHQNVVPKRAQLIGQIVRLDHRIDEVKTVKNVIEKDIRTEYGAIMERLRSAEGVKLAVLQHDVSEIQKDITRIDEILMTMEEIASNGTPMQQTQINPGQYPQFQQPPGQVYPGGMLPDMINFLHKYRQLHENIEYSVTKQFKVELDVFPNDMPRELAERRVLMEHYEEQRKWSKFKDDVIWKLTQELKQKYDYFQDEFDKETRHEMNEWARLVDRYATELKKYELVCAFCGQHLCDSNINQDCPDNQTGGGLGKGGSSMGGVGGIGGMSGRQQQQQNLPPNEMGSRLVYYTEEDPPMEIIGQKRHFFGRPSLKGYKQNPFRTQTAGLLKEEVILQNPEAAQVLKKIYEMDHGMKIDLDSKFRKFDSNNSGIIKKSDFINVLSDNVRSISGSELYQFMSLFTTSFDDVVNYDDFLKILYKFGEMPMAGGNINKIQDYSPTKNIRSQFEGVQNESPGFQQNTITQKIKESLLAKLQPKQKDLVERIKYAVKGQNVVETLRKLTRENQDVINENDLIIGLSQLNANVSIPDVKELTNILKVKDQNSGDGKMSIAEIQQLIGGQ